MKLSCAKRAHILITFYISILITEIVSSPTWIVCESTEAGPTESYVGPTRMLCGSRTAPRLHGSYMNRTTWPHGGIHEWERELWIY
jgi:hypothetical protein